MGSSGAVAGRCQTPGERFGLLADDIAGGRRPDRHTAASTPLRSPSSSGFASRPRSIRSLASYGAVSDSHTPPAENPEAVDIGRKSAWPGSLRTQLLVLSVVLLLAVCVYASFVDDFMGDVEASISCATCIGLLAPLQALARLGDDAFVDLFVGFCTKLGIEDADVCAGAVGTQAPILAHDLRSIRLASPAAKNFCTTIFGLCPLPNTIPHTVNLTEPPVDAGAEMLNGHPPRRTRKIWRSKGRSPFQVVHISDVHVDRSYTPGSSADCSKVICCRNYGPGSLGEAVKVPAGPFGHKKCDAPPALVESMFRAIDKLAPNKSFTIFTGDVVESAVWAVDQAHVSDDLLRWDEDMQSPSYPVVGNHDVAPVNAFPRSTSPQAHDSDWVFELAARDWRKWIGRDAADQVRKMSGCYSRVHPGTNLKIISLNTNYWYKQNFWLYDSDEPVWDPNGILTWLAHELDLAEQAGQRAWIIGHMPFGKVDAMRDQSNYANQIFQRYHNTIAAHFYGHSHVDEFEIAYPDYADRRAETANGIAFISGALTPTSGNPVFRVYDVDPDTYEVVDFVPHYANKSEPSFQIDPVWQPYYSARRSYGSYLDPPFPDDAPLNATFWHRVTEVFERNETVFQLFNVRLSRGGKIEDCSGPICKNNTICMLRSMRSESNCAVIQPGLSFKDQKRDTDAVTEPQRDEEANPSLQAASLQEEEYSQSRQHDYFACEGPGLASMLRKLGSGLAVPSSHRRDYGALTSLGVPRKTGAKPFSALHALRSEARRAVKRSRTGSLATRAKGLVAM
ncbi:RHTO0S12e01882g1_1 [Rhodotorula toruloides]|uniref:RHTO0S12e01882g1_1 n=2 Tax=Rhodotorula toruloides TaxID=5286 RepID=A0A061BGV4_RHOTO|nr:sphingomyelin phosphodiesterase [Rhodotorula toruloides NP11]EMS23256.1 sphingomyelin phosphodiesterase [Rhodotorula toruloides NP11]CDR46236.1 RHTO0S12e01882g1_1 [Rhodotorula toruloides]